MKDKLIIPVGKATGCKIRQDLPGTLCSFLPAAYVIPRSEWPKYIGQSSLRDAVLKIYDQGSVGSCAAEAATQSVSITRIQRGLEGVLLNPYFAYHTVSGGVDNGSTVGENVVFMRDVGACPESVWPRSKGWRAKPPQEAYEAAKEYRITETYEVSTLEEVGSALLRGFAVTYGWNGHSCVLVELKTTNSAIYANSWSPQWGDNGFGTIQLTSINFAYGAYAYRA